MGALSVSSSTLSSAILAVCLIACVLVYNNLSARAERDASGKDVAASSSASFNPDIVLSAEEKQKYTKKIELLQQKLDAAKAHSSSSSSSCPVCPKCLSSDSTPAACPKSQLIVAAAPPAPNVSGGGQGQVLMSQPFGQALYNLAKQSDVELFLEIGTWKGGGSSMCIAKGLKDSSGFLITLEANEPFWQEAKQTLSGYPVKCLLGVAVTNVSPREEVRADTEFMSSTPESVWSEWYDGEKQLMSYYEVGQLRPLCENRKFDAILLDGAEFAGKEEYTIAIEVCRPKYLALHDCNSFKNRWARADLIKNKHGYEVLHDDTSGVGWAIFKRKD